MGQPTTRSNPAVRHTGPARVLVAEPSGRWAVALRRELSFVVRVHETRSVAECWATLAQAPASLVVVEVTAGNLEVFLARMAQREREYPRSRVAVVADRRRAGYEWLVREAGAVMFVTSPRRCGRLAELARQHLALQPEQPRDTPEQIWTTLPWQVHASDLGAKQDTLPKA